MTGDGVDVDGRVGRGRDGRCDNDRVLEGPQGHDLAGSQILSDQRDSPNAGGVGHLRPLVVGGRYRRAAGQRHSQRLGQTVHRQCRTHGVAMPDAGRGRGHSRQIFVVVDLPAGQQPLRLPDHLTRPGPHAAMIAIEHRSSGEDDRRNIDRRRGAQTGGRGLVAARRQNHPVEWISVEHLDQSEIRQIPIQRRGRTLSGLLQRMNGEFERNAAAIADPGLDPVGEGEMVPIAGNQIITRLSDSDDRPARLKLCPGETEIQEPLEIESRHLPVSRVVPPCLTA